MTLTEQLKELVKKERALNVEIIRKLREVEDSKEFARMGYENMHEYCIGELKYSGAAADRRVKSMRLIRSEPQVENKLVSGEINLTTAAHIQRTFVQAEKQNVELPRKQIIEEVCGYSTREAEKKINQHAARAGMEVDLEDAEFEKDLEWLLAHLSHAHPGLKKDGLLKLLVKEKVAKLDPHRDRRKSGTGKDSDPEKRRPSEALKREVIKRDGGACTFVSAAGKRCGATRFVELDHIVPVAKGGLTKLSNLRLLCRTHNQLAAQDAGLSRQNSGAGKQSAFFH